jgi:formylglycine-generating enzyme required for sulfatase activity
VRGQRSMRVLWGVLLVAMLGACGDASDDASSSQRDATSSDAGEAAPADAQVGISESPATDEDAESSEERRRRLLGEAQAAAQWTPQLTPAQSDAVPDLMTRAEAAFTAGRLDQGEGNALDLYLSVLETDPAHADALAGVERVVQALKARIDAALQERRYAEAGTPMAVLRRLRGEDAEVAELGRRVAAAQEIAMLLGEARRFAEAGRILEPSEDNAAAVYAEVLQRDPSEPTALAELARLESELLVQATAAAEAGDYTRSDRLVADASRLRPGSGSVQDTSTRIVEMRQDRAGQLLQQAHDAIGSGDLARAEQLLAQLERVSAQSQGIEELRQRIEQARVYGGFAPGLGLMDALASGGSGPELVVLPVGSFAMGAAPDEAQRKKNEAPQHTVTFTRGFALARGETTVAQFRAFVAATGYRSSAQLAGRSAIYDERTGNLPERRGVDWTRDHAGRDAPDALPVVHVSWNDAKAYADWLSRETGKRYRLPSEAEFEYALRAGSTSRYWWGEGSPTRPVENLTGEHDRSQSRRAWNNGFAGYGDGYWGAAPVRSFAANRFGVHDANGNVSEWVEDCWHDNYSRAPLDGSAWVNPGCSKRVIRGASWASAPDQARSAFRLSAPPDSTNARLGFRVARDL